MNLMQYHGGTNFDRMASAYVTTAYYDEAPLDEYGMLLSFIHLPNCRYILFFGS